MKTAKRVSFRKYAEGVMELACSGDAWHYDEVAMDWRAGCTVEGMKGLAKEAGMLEEVR